MATNILVATNISGLTMPVYNSGAANKKYVDVISGNLNTKYNQYTGHSGNKFAHITTAFSSNVRSLINFSSNSKSLYANSSNISRRFVASGVRLQSISSQNISSSSIRGNLVNPSMTFSVANIQISAQQNINLARFKTPSDKRVCIWQASACGSGGYAVSGMFIQMLSNSTLPLNASHSKYKTSSQIVKIGYPLATSAVGDFVEIRFMYSSTANGLAGSGYKYGTGFMNISLK